jgi:N-acetylglucosamine-6-phosphate deacetylase
MSKAYHGARIFTGETWVDGRALLVRDGRIAGLAAPGELPDDAERIDAAGTLIVPGFIDLQVNGGGGVMLNDMQTVEGIRTICAAHARFGTTALLPTLITDRPDITEAAIAAGLEAKMQAVPGFLGLHLEGPHLSLARKGAHDPALIRKMEEADLARLLDAAPLFDVLMTTVAPENATAEQVARLAEAGILVSIGHTDSGFETVRTYAAAGARAVTHLFNAMSQLGNREPGVVGAALEDGRLSAGIIADGFHVHPASMHAALAAKRGPGRIFIVTDAMSTIGTDLASFTLNGREILRENGKLTLADGTLAGADIDMLASVRFVHERLGLPLEEALRMASLYPAEAARVESRKGAIREGMDADFVQLTPELGMFATHIGGTCVFRA